MQPSQGKKTQGQSKQTRAKIKAARAKMKRKQKIRKIVCRSLLSVMTVLVVVSVGALCMGYVAFKGPSETVGDLLTVSMLETSALKFVPRIYYSDAQMEEIIARNAVGEAESETDATMIVIAGPDDPVSQLTQAPENLISSEDGIDLYRVQGATYNGYMMVVHDPSRVSVGVCREEFNSKPGLQLHEIAERYGAVAAINGGGFEDSGGVGNGGRPKGLVFSNGKLLHKNGGGDDSNVLAGFDENNVLRIGRMTSTEAKEKGIRDGVSFGPALIVNGEAVKVSGASSGLNPRTAIGQCRDGSVLLLVIDGRTASSLGATYADVITQMLEFGAINAMNLDGGSSSMMYYKGEYLNRGVILTGARDIPTGFIVR